MSLLDEIKQCNNLHKIPKEIHVNKGVLLDFRLVEALENPNPDLSPASLCVEACPAA